MQVWYFSGSLLQHQVIATNRIKTVSLRQYSKAKKVNHMKGAHKKKSKN